MNAFFPGFEPAAATAASVTVITIRPVTRLATPPARTTTAPKAAPVHIEAFTQRVAWFTRSLPPAQRAAIARRPRFHTLPWLRRSAE